MAEINTNPAIAQNKGEKAKQIRWYLESDIGVAQTNDGAGGVAKTVGFCKMGIIERLSWLFSRRLKVLS